jgi:transcriptional regulator with XRE-family HTH domain
MKPFSESPISNFVKYKRGIFKLKQEELAEKAGVRLRFLRELEQGKKSLRMDKINQVLRFFVHRISPLLGKTYDPYAILLNGL